MSHRKQQHTHTRFAVGGKVRLKKRLIKVESHLDHTSSLTSLACRNQNAWVAMAHTHVLVHTYMCTRHAWTVWVQSNSYVAVYQGTSTPYSVSVLWTHKKSDIPGADTMHRKDVPSNGLGRARADNGPC